MGTLYIVRHSITDLNDNAKKGDSAERVRGWLDVPLSRDGWEIAKKAAGDLTNRGIIKIYSSDLIRAQETAEVISGVTGAPVETSDLLRPWNVGVLQGKNYDEAKKIMAFYANKKPDTTIKDGESYFEFYNRWKFALTKMLNAVSKMKPEMALCCVTHSRNVYCLEHILSFGKSPIRWHGLLDPAGIIEINVDKDIIRIVSNEAD